MSTAILVAVGGWMASGKSTVSRALAKKLGAIHIEADELRATFERGGRDDAFVPGFSDVVYERMFADAERFLGEGRRVVLDGTFRSRERRAHAREVAARRGVPFRFLECQSDAQVIRNRLGERDDPEGWLAMFEHFLALWEPVTELAAGERIRLDTSRPDPPIPGAVELGLESPLKPRTVTFDCWSTLLYEPEPLRSFEPRVRAVAHAAKSAGKPVDDETARLALDSAWRRHSALWNDGQGSTAHDIAAWSLAELGIPEPDAAIGLGAALGEASLGSHVLALDGARDTLAKLCEQGVRTALICDTGFTPGRIIRVLLERVGLLEHLEVCIFSDEVGVPKPHRRMFEAALEPLRARPHESVHVGDLRRTDIAGAHGAGMRAVRLRWHYDDDSEHPEADAVADSHAHLLEILGY